MTDKISIDGVEYQIEKFSAINMFAPKRPWWKRRNFSPFGKPASGRMLDRWAAHAELKRRWRYVPFLRESDAELRERVIASIVSLAAPIRRPSDEPFKL